VSELVETIVAAFGMDEIPHEDAELEIAAIFALGVRRYRPVVVVTVAASGEPGLEVLLDAAIEHGPARLAWPIPRRRALSGPAPGPHARPCAPHCGVGVQVGRHKVPAAIGHRDDVQFVEYKSYR